MFNRFMNRRRGSVIAFVLMGLIAVLAIVVVLLSRAAREPAVSSSAATTETTGTLNEHAVPVAETGDEATSEASGTVQLPPPPPPVSSTPDTRNLPPEG